MEAQSIFLAKKKEVVAAIRKELRANPKVEPNYLAYWKQFFPNEPRMGYFKQHFDKWIARVRKDLRLPKVPRSKILPKSLTSPLVHHWPTQKETSLSKKRSVILQAIVADLKQHPEKPIDYRVYWKTFYPEEHKMGNFKFYFDRWVKSARRSLELPQRTNTRPPQPQELYTLKGKKFIPYQFAQKGAVLKGLPEQLQAHIIDNPGKPIPTLPVAVYMGVVRSGERLQAKSDLQQKRIPEMEVRRNLAAIDHRMTNMQVVKVSFARKIRERMKREQQQKKRVASAKRLK